MTSYGAFESEVIEQNVEVEQDEHIDTKESMSQTQNITIGQITTIHNIIASDNEWDVPVTKHDNKSLITDVDGNF